MNREQYQLYTISKYYLGLAERGRKYPQIMSMTSNQISEASDNKITMNPGMRIMSHLASCAFRLCSLWETYNRPRNNYRYKYYIKQRNTFYRRDDHTQESIKNDILENLSHHIHYLLRDASGHKENNDQIPWEDRQYILADITNLKALDAMKEALDRIRTDLYE